MVGEGHLSSTAGNLRGGQKERQGDRERRGDQEKREGDS